MTRQADATLAAIACAMDVLVEDGPATVKLNAETWEELDALVAGCLTVTASLAWALGQHRGQTAAEVLGDLAGTVDENGACAVWMIGPTPDGDAGKGAGEGAEDGPETGT